jgi:type II secretory ATPase GspE/PulE/Tfp pilus assembly ATPase PilB-like protein
MYHMGIEPFLISACMTGIISQRLVRTVCKDCAQEVQYDEEKLKTIRHFLPEGTEYHFKVGKGCNNCHQSGYKGRTAIYEVLLVTPLIREGIVAGKDTDELRTMCRHDGMKLLVECGMLKAAKGITSIEEVLRVARAEEAPEHGG